MTTGQFQRAKIEVVENGATKKGQSVEFMYNPDSISFSKSVKWQETSKPTSNNPESDFAGGETGTFEISQAVFDGTVPLDGESSPREIGESISQLLNLMDIDKSLKPARPPRCRFVWGNFRSFDVYVQSVKVRYEFFDRSGKPLRAKVDITFKQAEDQSDIQGQNPTSRSYARKIHTVIEGETLDWIAYQEYGDPAVWRHIAEVNNLADPMHLRPGQVLKLVPIEL